MTESRRWFLIQSSRLAAALATPWISRPAFSTPLGLPVGIQLYTVKEAMQENPAGTLKKLREIGYREVETAGFGKLSARQFRGQLDEAGLGCPSAHLQFDNLDSAFENAHALGARYATTGSLRASASDPNRVDTSWTPSMNLEDAKRTARLANHIGEAAKRAGLQFVYHNHNFEFAKQEGGVVCYDVLLRETDPDLVKFEIDCGWMIFAGRNPIDYFKKYPNRFPMIHVKDFLPDNGTASSDKAPMLGAELGHGVVDYKPIFAAAKAEGLKHYFVEQEGPFSRMDPLQSTRVDFEYLRSIG
jgi:sugar phosphate isomerase/epimerase